MQHLGIVRTQQKLSVLVMSHTDIEMNGVAGVSWRGGRAVVVVVVAGRGGGGAAAAGGSGGGAGGGAKRATD